MPRKTRASVLFYASAKTDECAPPRAHAMRAPSPGIIDFGGRPASFLRRPAGKRADMRRSVARSSTSPPSTHTSLCPQTGRQGTRRYELAVAVRTSDPVAAHPPFLTPGRSGNTRACAAAIARMSRAHPTIRPRAAGETRTCAPRRRPLSRSSRLPRARRPG